MRRAAALLLAGLSLQACHAIPDIAGVVAGAGAGSGSANPAVGIAVGIAVRSGVRALTNYIDRKRATGEQDAIAETAGAAPIGQPRRWEIRHTIPIGNERGDLEAVREFATPLTTCREIVFTVVDGDERDILTTTLCRQQDGWRWAAAEPAVDRWGFLQ
jgi:surface antigen